MFSSQVCSIFHSHPKLTSCHWSSPGRSITNERGTTSFGYEQSCQSSAQLFVNKKAHPKRHLLCALIATILFLPTGLGAIYFASKSWKCECHGHYEQALIYSNRSFSWAVATFVIALFLYLTVGLFIVICKSRPY
ncbi:unnamed protein product [Adineta ricciae]|uniref:Uncharacterized protein n=1 Tax=Adineta ricciae TaxID=249248 RepID=A0A813Z8P3_ADIRI|nr:unnamed protein product [Adineta ricciae]CAF0894790.1 unnamed protein product [Adineta ricciae]